MQADGIAATPLGHTAVPTEYPKLVPDGKLRGYWLLAPGVFQPPCGFSVEPPFVCLLPRGHDGAHYMADTSSGGQMTVCIECVMTWLRFGDGAICLACRAPVVWKGTAK